MATEEFEILNYMRSEVNSGFTMMYIFFHLILLEFIFNNLLHM